MKENNTFTSNQKLIILLSFILVIIISSLLTLSISVFVIQIFLVSITLFFCFQYDYKTSQLMLIIFCVSLIYIFFIYYANIKYYGSPYYLGGSDDLKFEQWGYLVYESNIYNPRKLIEFNVLDKYHNSPFFPIYIARIIQFSKLFDGYTTFIPRIMNAYYLVWICLIVQYFLKKYTYLSKKSIYYSLAFFSLMPNIQYINSHVFRDTFNLLQVLWIVLLIDIILTKKNYLMKIICFILLPLSLYTTYYVRVNSLLFVGIAVLLILKTRFKIKLIYFIVISLVLLLCTDLLDIFKIEYYIKTYSQYLSHLAGDGLSKYVFNTPLLPFGIFLRALYALISPFPNFFGLFQDNSKLLLDVLQCMINIGVVIQILALPFLLKRIFNFDWLTLIFLSWFLAISVSTFTFRHFQFFYPFFTAICVDGYMKSNKNTRSILIAMSIFFSTFLCTIYFAIKFFL